MILEHSFITPKVFSISHRFRLGFGILKVAAGASTTFGRSSLHRLEAAEVCTSFPSPVTKSPSSSSASIECLNHERGSKRYLLQVRFLDLLPRGTMLAEGPIKSPSTLVVIDMNDQTWQVYTPAKSLEMLPSYQNAPHIRSRLISALSHCACEKDLHESSVPLRLRLILPPRLSPFYPGHCLCIIVQRIVFIAAFLCHILSSINPCAVLFCRDYLEGTTPTKLSPPLVSTPRPAPRLLVLP